MAEHRLCVICNKLTINAKKTKILPFYPKSKVNYLDGFSFKLDGFPLEIVSDYTYLGIKLDSKLMFEKHIHHLCGNVYPMVYNFGLIRKYLNFDSAVIILKAYILSKVKYGSIFCIGARKTVIDKLQKIVNSGLPKTNYYESNFKLHVRANLLPLRIRRKIATLNQMFLIN